MKRGNARHSRLRKRESRVKAELRRRGGANQGHSWAAKQAARRVKSHKRLGSVAGSIYH